MFVGCTHIAILKPKEEEHNFINRKGYHSLNVQIISDPNLKIININSNYGGSTNDAFIWRYSNVRRYMQHIHNMGETNSWLIGDSGYPLQPFLMTPVINPERDAAEARYNQAHASARNGVERTIGLLKMRFRCLLKERIARYEPRFVSKMVVVCAILHNMCVTGGVPLIGDAADVLPENELEALRNIPLAEHNPNFLLGQQTRNNIVRRYFNNN